MPIEVTVLFKVVNIKIKNNTSHRALLYFFSCFVTAIIKGSSIGATSKDICVYLLLENSCDLLNIKLAQSRP